MTLEDQIKSALDNQFNGMESLKNYIDTNQNDCIKLHSLKQYIEIQGLQNYYCNSYLQIKLYLKNIALEKQNKHPETNKPAETAEELEKTALYEWLKICINPMKDPNYDFFFDKEGINKDEEVKGILFKDKRNEKIREIFKDNEWQPRLKKIMVWFLRRYDRKSAKIIYNNLEPKSIFDRIDLYFPRILGSIFLGFLPLISASEMWYLPINLNSIWLLILSVLSLLVSIFYFRFEYYKATSNKDWWKPLKVFFRGFFYSSILSILLTILFHHNFVGNKSWIDLLKIMILFSSSSLLIGIFIQVFWEEKTIAEPL